MAIQLILIFFIYRHGKGTYQWNDGSKYEGDWVENKITGNGKY